MLNGVAYDSDEGRNLCGAITSLMTGRSYLRSAEIARRTGPFAEYEKNRAPFLEVIGLHTEYGDQVPAVGRAAGPAPRPRATPGTARSSSAAAHGYRNAQVTVIAPTGTIAFMMDCDTTGIEPDIALVKYKSLVGGGVIKIVNRTVPAALARRGYTPEQIEKIVAYIDEHDTIEGAPELEDEHLSIFDCAFTSAHGTRSIHYMGHIRMMAAAQPFLSGGISKTVNLPKDATVEDIEEAYTEGWRLGPQVTRDLPRRLEAHPAAEHQGRQGRGAAGGGRRRGRAAPPQAARRARREDPQVLDLRPRRLRDRRPVRGRHARAKCS